MTAATRLAEAQARLDAAQRELSAAQAAVSRTVYEHGRAGVPLYERDTFPPSYLRQLVGVGVDGQPLPGPGFPQAGQLGQRADDNGDTGERSGELHPVIARIVRLIQRGIHHGVRAVKRLGQVVVALLVEVDVDDVTHDSAPSAGPEGSVGASSAQGSAPRAEDHTTGGAQ